jgi:hypothetical protein
MGYQERKRIIEQMEKLFRLENIKVMIFITIRKIRKNGNIEKEHPPPTFG